MRKTKLQIEHEKLQEKALRDMAMIRAKHENDIAVLLRPWFTFRVFVKFKKAFYDKKGHKKDSQHFYGLEHACSYRQCLYGHVSEIQLNKLQGYETCITMAEQKFRNKYYFARIYARTSFPDGKFDLLCREYNEKGEIREQQDPVITQEDNRTLFFTVINGMLSLSEIDFKTEIQNNLNETTNCIG